MCIPVLIHANTIYVNVNAMGTNSGTSWTNAYTDLQLAIVQANSGDVIWVAKGTYKPTATTTKTISFEMKSGVVVYGGFAGTESLLSERVNYRLGEQNETILSGDIGTLNDPTDNSYHVIEMTYLTEITILDGFTITGGNAEGTAYTADRNGGGLYLERSGSYPQIKNCTFSSNTAQYGGAICIDGSVGNATPVITDCLFTGNVALNGTSGSGGAVYNKGASSNETSPVFYNCAFINNSAFSYGGAIYNNAYNCTVNTELYNCTFYGNEVTTNNAGYGGRGGAIYNANYNNIGTCQPILTNCILYGNTATMCGHQIGNDSYSVPNISYSFMQGGLSISACCNHLCTDGGNNITTGNPLFVDVAQGDLRIYGSSPCVNVGLNSANSTDTDIRGQVRIQNTTIEMGAYEYTEGTDPIRPVFTWQGDDTNVPDAWYEANNWDKNAVPTSTDNVIVPGVTNDPVIADGTGASCYDLTVNEGATLTINSGGSLITDGTITNSGTINIKRNITSGVWHLISNPITSATANIFVGNYLQNWDETSGTWSDIVETSTSLTPGKGYSLWTIDGTPTDYTFTGTPNSGNQSTGITANGSGGSYNGANLLGNPYPSSIDWYHVSGFGAVYYWDGNAEGEAAYVAYPQTGSHGTGSRYVPPMQGFFIVIPDNDPSSFTFTNAMRTHSGATSYYKNEKSLPDGLMLYASNGIYQDKLLIRLNDEATADMDYDKDAWKFPSNTEGLSQLWSVCPEGNLSIDVRPYQETIQLGFANDVAGLYTIGISEIAEITSALLEDTKANLFHDLTKGAYEFAWDVNDDENRFKLHLNVVGLEETPGIESNILIYAANGNIFIKGAENGEVRVSDLTGRTVLQQQINGEEIISIPANLKTGIYLVMVQQGNEVKTEKIFIR